MKSIILLSGPVGAGKSTVATELVAALPAPTAYIEGDTFWSFIAKGGSSQGMPKNFTTIMASMTAAAVPYALAGYTVVVDFSIPPWFLKTARTITKFQNVPLDYVVLRPSESVCAARAANRTEGRIPDYARYRELYTEFGTFSTASTAERHTIKDDESDAATVALRIRDDLGAGVFRVA